MGSEAILKINFNYEAKFSSTFFFLFSARVHPSAYLSIYLSVPVYIYRGLEIRVFYLFTYLFIFLRIRALPGRCPIPAVNSHDNALQTALERHVNGHFNQPETSNNNARRSCESGGKLVRRNGKRLRYRRQPWSGRILLSLLEILALGIFHYSSSSSIPARLFDYFDSGVMEGLQHRLLQLAKSRTQGRLAETPGNSMALTSQVSSTKRGKNFLSLRFFYWGIFIRIKSFPSFLPLFLHLLLLQVLARRVEMDGKTKVLLRWYPQDM